MESKILLDLCRVRYDKKASTKYYGYFQIGPLARGYGHTLGNSLRRILLSSIGGAVITSVKITEVVHEFSVLQGVKEDVTQIILNLKKIRFKLHDITKKEYLNLNVTHSGKVVAKDIQLNSNVEIMNPEQEIANLDKDAKLEMQLTIAYGTGYVIADESDNDEIGIINLDAMFSPIIKVNYEVNNARVGDELNYDDLLIEIDTDGSISPKSSLISAAKILTDNLSIFFNNDKFVEIAHPNIENTSFQNKSQNINDNATILQQSINNIQLSKRILNTLNNAGIYVLEQLVKLTKDDIMKLKNLGKSSIEEIEDQLNSFNLHLAKENSNDKNT
ncbi:MAG: DNA-directed RNA polymerase subunit alpha [Endomicrobium sp.]|jgi:DNA-directed RNA polymerase subunit alpha|nr:DNA-directed RNA polymerase subunit alpha [Endomicrobium sp.]